MVRVAHRHGLAAAQKNTVELNGRRLGFDFAIAEECGRWHECRGYKRMYGQHVLAIEYRRRDLRRHVPGVPVGRARVTWTWWRGAHEPFP